MSVNVKDKTVCLTGIVPDYSREQAQALLRQAGAHTVSTVTKNTHLLITGANVGARKIEKAEKIGVTVIGWEEIAWDGNGDDVVATHAAPPPALGAFKQIAPMLAVSGELSDTDGEDWVYENKWDGIRGVAHIEGHRVHIQSRSAKSDLTARFPIVAGALAGYSDCILDGELVVLDEANSGGSFGKIAQHSQGGSARFIVFDVIEHNGASVRQQPFTQRRELLETLVQENDVITLSPVWDDGEALLAVVREKGLEGIVAKPKTSTYREGHRGPWMKIKVRCNQEFVVVGYKPGEGHVEGGVGALLLAVNDETAGGLIMCGAAGTGFKKPYRFELREQLDLIADPSTESKLAMTAQERRELAREGAVWVRPELVAQVEFQRWTDDDRLWHPSFQGLRDDKDPADVVREPCAGEA